MTMRPHWISTVAFSLWAALSGFLLTMLVFWQWIDEIPFKITSEPVLEGPARVTIHDVIVVRRTVCVSRADMAVTRHVDWTSAAGVLYRAPSVTVLTVATPCAPVRVAYPVPDDLLPGRYTVRMSWYVPLNPLRHLSVDGGTVEVEVTP